MHSEQLPKDLNESRKSKMSNRLNVIILNVIRYLVGGIVSALPYFRGLGRGYRMFNRFILKLGATPIVVARMKGGYKLCLDLRSYTELGAYYEGKYDQDLLNIILFLFDHNTVFLDIGANIGFYSVPIANSIQVNKSFGRVICFEPFHGNCVRLIENLKMNKILQFCEVIEIGLSDDNQKKILTLREDFLNGSETGNAAIATNEKFDAHFKELFISVRKLDDIRPKIIKEHERIDFVKLDIEGHEDYCLAGAYHTFRKYRPTIFMEVNKPYYEARDVNLNERILSVIPKDYIILRRCPKLGWVEIKSLDLCNSLEDIFLIPSEKSQYEKYKNTFACLEK
jgi:FkbM family methyltransferase